MKPYRKYFTETIARSFPAEYAEIMSSVEDQYKLISEDVAFAASSGNPLDKRLDFSAYFLALIITLDRRKETFDHIRQICLSIVTEYVQPRHFLERFLKKLPAKFAGTFLARMILARMSRKIKTKAHEDGFVASIITAKDETFDLGYGIDILECGICKLFSKYNYQKYTPILCEVDRITSSLSGLQLVRQGTIAQGYDKCDFRFKKI